MKKAIAILLILVVVMCMSACGGEAKGENVESPAGTHADLETQVLGTWEFLSDYIGDYRPAFGEYMILYEGGVGKAKQDLDSTSYSTLEWSVTGDYIRIKSTATGTVEVFELTIFDSGSKMLVSTDGRSNIYKLRITADGTVVQP